MITGELKRDIDALWLEFLQGGITDPLTVIEQITYLMFACVLDVNEVRDENRARRSGKAFRRRFGQDEQGLRWSHFRHLGEDDMLSLVRDEVFPHFRKKSTNGIASAEFMKDARLMIEKPSLLVKAVNMIDKLPLTDGNTRGDLYEYLLSKLTTAGINGQFRTPRHIIRLMVDILEPKPTDVVADPSAGTGGFLVQVMEHLMEKFTSPEGVIQESDPDTGKKHNIYTGDLLEKHLEHIRTKMFHGFDSDATMLRIAAMNLMLHDVDNPDIHYQDTLSSSFSERFPEEAKEGFDIVLATPPFKGSLDYEDVDIDLLRQVKTNKTELLFLVLVLRMLKPGGRSAAIVPDSLLFGSSMAHVALRKLLIDKNQLEAVISLPGGVFKPYAGVSTGILVFTKGGRTDNVFFYDVQADGFSLDDRRDPTEENDLPACLASWQTRDPRLGGDDMTLTIIKEMERDLAYLKEELINAISDHQQDYGQDVQHFIRQIQDVLPVFSKNSDRTDKTFFVSAKEIREANYDLSLNRYKETVYQKEEYDPPKVILERMKVLDDEIASDLIALEDML